jgi:putative thioredoxin
LAEAKRLLEEGANSAAAQLLEPIVASEPGNSEARVLLAQALLGTDPDRITTLLSSVGPESELSERADAIKSLARLAQLVKRPTALLEANVRDRYLAGAVAVSSGNFGAALEALIDELGRNKQYENGGAKAACKAIFQLLGMRHALVERSFRAFSSALHS